MSLKQLGEIFEGFLYKFKFPWPDKLALQIGSQQDANADQRNIVFQ